VLGETDNPYDRLGLPPGATPEEITELLRERLAEAAPEEQAELRAIWERLMRHPRERVILALGAHPRDRDAGLPLRAPPPVDPASITRAAALTLPLEELVPLPSLAREVASMLSGAPARPALSPLDLLLQDPILDSRSGPR
jgi:hypothetical protein